MDETEKPSWLKDCERNGISWARGILPNASPGIQPLIRRWIDERESEEEANLRADQRKLALDAIDAARAAASVSRDAAIAARDAAKWTMVAALAAGAGVLVTVAQGLGWLPKM